MAHKTKQKEANNKNDSIIQNRNMEDSLPVAETAGKAKKQKKKYE